MVFSRGGKQLLPCEHSLLYHSSFILTLGRYDLTKFSVHLEDYTVLSSPFFADLISKMPQNNRCFGKFVGVQRFSQFLSTFLSGESDHFTVHFPLNPWSLLVGGYSGLSND